MSSYEEQVDGLISILTEAKVDAEKFDHGNDAAGRRLRKACMVASRGCKDVRASVQETRNSRK